MIIRSYKGKTPDIKKAAFIAENAVIIGDVTLGEGSSVWYGAVLRADDEKIVVGKNSNIQDNCTVHCSKGFPAVIGDGVTIGHNALIHGCTIGSNCLIGMHSTVMNGASLGNNCLVGAGALVTENKKFKDNTLLMGVPAKAVAEIDGDAADRMKQNAAHYREKAAEFKKEQAKPLPMKQQRVEQNKFQKG